MTSSSLNIFSVFHKQYPVPACDFITPIQVNKQATGIETGFISDDTGDNIAGKNERFCEYTALYWIWKNLDQFSADNIGLSHYRRYFTVKEHQPFLSRMFSSSKKDHVITLPLNEQSLKLAASGELKEQMIDLLDSGYTIVPYPESFAISKKLVLSVKNQFIFNHLREDWLIAEEAIKNIYPDYAKSLEYFDANTAMRPYNMFVGDKQFLKDYCSWVFPLLFEIEKKLPVSPYPYQRRTIGFIGERLFNFYIDLNKIKLAEMPIIFLE